MSWIYGASGGMNFWEEQIKNEKRLKKTWGAKYGRGFPPPLLIST